MSTNENNPLPDSVPGTAAVPVHRSAPISPMDTGWANVSDYELPPEASGQSISPTAYLHGLRRHWVSATGLGILCAVAAALGVWFGWGPRYTASAYFQIAAVPPKVVFETQETQVSRLTQNSFDIYKDTQAQLVQSTRVLEAALLDPEVANLGIVLREEDAVRWLQRNLRVSFPGEAELMEVSLTANDWKGGEDVAEVVKAVVNAYQKGILDVEQTRRNARLDELRDVYEEKRDDVKARSQQLRQLAETLGTSDAETVRLREQMSMRQFGDIQSQHSQALIALERARGDLRAQRTLLENVDVVPIPELDVEDYVNRNPMVRQLSDSLSGQQLALAEAERSVSPLAPDRLTKRYSGDVFMLENRIAALGTEAKTKLREKMRSLIEDQIRQLEVQVEVLADQEQRLATAVLQQQAEIDKLSTSSIDLQMVQAEIDRSNEVLTSVSEEAQRMLVELKSDPRVQLLQNADTPKSEDRFGVRVALTVLASIVGLCIPVGSITWWDTRAERINSVDDVSKRLGLTVLGSVPRIPTRAVRDLGSASKSRQTWHLRLTESIDGIAARLLHQADVRQTRVVLISSASGGEGKTTLATQLAMSLARNGRHTALVDFDLRRPAFDKVLGLPLEPGVSEVLRGQNDASEVIHPTGTENLDVVTAGRWNRLALTALANGAAGSLLDALRAKYDFVVVDSAPILPVADTRFVSQHVDTVILSVFRDISRSPKIAAAVETLDAFGVSSVDAVVTGPTDNLPDKDLRYALSQQQ